MSVETWASVVGAVVDAVDDIFSERAKGARGPRGYSGNRILLHGNEAAHTQHLFVNNIQLVTYYCIPNKVMHLFIHLAIYL